MVVRLNTIHDRALGGAKDAVQVIQELKPGSVGRGLASAGKKGQQVIFLHAEPVSERRKDVGFPLRPIAEAGLSFGLGGKGRNTRNTFQDSGQDDIVFHFRAFFKSLLLIRLTYNSTQIYHCCR